jgi:phosphoribosylaminoimidazole-succinocarboxamide synthase
VLNQIAAYWFDVTKHMASNHVIEVPDPTVMIATECEVIPVEFVMRAYVTGVTTTSIWHHYTKGVRRFCGHDLPDGMKKNQKLDRPILTPSTKAAKGGHDMSVSRDDVLAQGLLSPSEFDRAAEMCARVFAFGQSLASQRGLILVDTKYEIGRRRDGSLCFIDEVHTPDSSRYWYADDYQSRFERGDEPRGLDKEYVRHKLAAQGYTGEGAPPPLSDEIRCEAARRYVSLYELITGREFVPDFDEPLARIRKNLDF